MDLSAQQGYDEVTSNSRLESEALLESLAVPLPFRTSLLQGGKKDAER